jgi:hypothetical protein
VEAALTGMLDRRWYTNHGPLARFLEAEWAEARDRKHAIAVANPTIGLVMMAEALAPPGEVLLSALAAPRCAQALSWAGLRPRFCDIDPDTLGLDVPHAMSVPAILATPGAPASIGGRSEFVFGDGVDGLTGPTLIDLPGLGDDAGAACILTDDDQLAARLRNMRSSYGAGPPVSVAKTANGRLSEAQAAMALVTLAGRSFQSFALESLADVLDGKGWLPYGREILVLAKTPGGREPLAQAMAQAGLTTRPVVLDERAASCTRASAVAERGVLVQPKLAGGVAD